MPGIPYGKVAHMAPSKRGGCKQYRRGGFDGGLNRSSTKPGWGSPVPHFDAFDTFRRAHHGQPRRGLFQVLTAKVSARPLCATATNGHGLREIEARQVAVG